MPSFLLSKLKQAQPSMRRRLFLYMGALAALLLAVLLVALLLLGQLKSPRAETEKALTFQMGAFRSDMASLWRNVSVMGIHLSEDMTAIIEEQTSDFSSLNGDVDAVGALQEAMLEPLCQYVRQTDCSGAFILLGASLSSDPAVDSQISANIELQKLLVDLYLGKRMSSAEHPQFEKLMEEIRSHLNKWWTVGEMAELCNMSDDQMRRLFIASTGMRPKVYVDRLKLRRAAEMLAGTDMKISEIAETLGYLDPYHFSRRFKKIMGISPLRYRESAPDAMRFSGPS